VPPYLLSINHYDLSITVYRALECRPDTYRDWYDQGNILKERMDYFGALISYEKALEYYPDDFGHGTKGV